jgi:predicted HicB family RNase H-like nuclease
VSLDGDAAAWSRGDPQEKTPMARKSTKGDAGTPAAGTNGLRAVRLELDEGLHKLLRIEAAKEDMSLAAMARTLIAEALERRAKS